MDNFTFVWYNLAIQKVSKFAQSVLHWQKSLVRLSEQRHLHLASKLGED